MLFRSAQIRPIAPRHAPPALYGATWLDTLAAWLLALLWILPLAYAFWTAFHPPEYSARFDLAAPWTLENFRRAWQAAPFARYRFRGQGLAFALVLVQLMIMPDILLVANYQTLSRLGAVDTLLGIGLPYFASAFAIFLLRQTFLGIPRELDEAARVEGASTLQILWRVYVPLARPVYLAFALVSVSFHWNNFLWPLIITNSVQARPLTVGLQVFSSVESGVEWATITAATLMSSGPLLVAFVLFQRQFVQSFMRAGIK